MLEKIHSILARCSKAIYWLIPPFTMYDGIPFSLYLPTMYLGTTWNIRLKNRVPVKSGTLPTFVSYQLRKHSSSQYSLNSLAAFNTDGFFYSVNLINIHELISVCPSSRNVWIISETPYSSQTKLIGQRLCTSEHGIGYLILAFAANKGQKRPLFSFRMTRNSGLEHQYKKVSY